ncbi:MAG: Peptide deformylase [Parcubacteria group bacterium GW2011_GWA2_39_18]|nr:MAG: Peptide deformylase [Parcubacteria group bacterium GW2011_GWA2_39_18]
MQNKLKIVKYPEKILNVSCREISPKEIPGLKDLIEQMYQKMREEDGVGLAAPQIGKNIKLAVIEVMNERYTIINPRIVRSSDKKNVLEEGCLSVPKIFGFIKRAKRVKVEALDENGKKVKIKAEGLLAQALQHEIDHLDGKLFIEKARELFELKEDK